MASLIVQPQRRPLTGAVSVPGDKSISHRAVMLAALAEGASIVDGWLPAGDTLATLAAIKALGVQITVERRQSQNWKLVVEGRGLTGLRPAAGPLDCANAGTCMRLLAGILSGQRFSSVLHGSPQLQRRPMGRIIEPLRLMGAHIRAENDRAPLAIEPGSLNGISYPMPVASAQVKSAILLAGLYARGETRLFQPGPARDHTERMLQAMGVDVKIDGAWVCLKPSSTAAVPADFEQGVKNGRLPEQTSRPAAWELPRLKPLVLIVPGDISSAAFLLVAAAIVPHSQITVQNTGVNETRTGLLDILATMGAQISAANRRTTGGEPAAELSGAFAELHGAGIGGDLVVRAIDEFPVWAVAATQAVGSSELRGAAELRLKEVDRISLLAGELGKMGAKVSEHSDGLTINGPTRLQGAHVNSHGDHRLGMALAVAGLAAAGSTLVQNADCIADSFPGFVETMQSLGADMAWTET